MIYISAQPCNNYFIWQVDTMLTSQEEVGINLADIHVVFAALELFEDTEQRYQDLLDKWVPKGVKFFNYMDERKFKGYIPSTKTYLLWKHWQNNPVMEQQSVFLTDSDVIFLRKPKEHSDGIWRMSNTNSYISWDYISQKGEKVQDLFFEVFDVDRDYPKTRNLHSGGAQYSLHNVPTDYWRQSQLKSEELWKNYHALSEKDKKDHNTEYDLQIWTAEMWSNLWCAWELGIEPVVDPDLDFAWSVDNLDSIGDKFLLHNSGVTCSCNGLFYKGDWILHWPKPIQLIDTKKASALYYKTVVKALYGEQASEYLKLGTGAVGNNDWKQERKLKKV